MPVRATVGGQTRKHQAKVVQQLGRSSERAPDAGDSGSLMQRKGCRGFQISYSAGTAVASTFSTGSEAVLCSASSSEMLGVTPE